MTIEEYLRQESAMRAGVHFHDGVWWKNASPGSCQPLYPLQEIPAGGARPRLSRSFLRYSHVVPAADAAAASGRTKTRLLIQGENLRNYSLANIADRKRRQAINKAVRCGFKTALIRDPEKHRRDLLEIHVSNAERNRYGLPPEWYREHEDEWWRNFMREFELPGRDWFGAFQGEKLVAYLYDCLVGDTAVMLTAKSHRGYLVSDPNDLLWFDSFLHYQAQPECRRIDAGWAIPLPPTIDWRKRSLGFEAVELPIFEKTNRAAMGLVRAALFCAQPLLDSPLAQRSNRGLLFHARTVRKRLEDAGGGG